MFPPARLLGQVEYSYNAQGTAPSPLATIIALLIALVLIVAMWKVFIKAGQPGWARIIPIYTFTFGARLSAGPDGGSY